MPATIELPTHIGTLEAWRSPQGSVPAPRIGAQRHWNRIAYSAAHVVVDPLRNSDPWVTTAIDWDRTIAYRRYLVSLGFGIAEAMDTAQRGMGVDWPTSLELIRQSILAIKDIPGALIAAGCGTDQLDPRKARTLSDVVDAYEAQIEAVEALDGRLILMASRALAAVARSPEDYVTVYSKILKQVRAPVILHWLGDMFDPELAGYWGWKDVDPAMDVAVAIIQNNASKVDGIKISLLKAEHEIAMRRRLPAHVHMYTGDDFNFPELIAGDGVGALPNHRHSHALLGIFDPIAPIASVAFDHLANDDQETFLGLLNSTVPLSRHVFQAPTRFYKTGVVFLAWLNGHQDHFSMAGGQQSARSLLHLSDMYRLADKAGVLINPDLAISRMKAFLTTQGYPSG